MDIWSVAHVDYRLPLDEHYDHITIFHTHGSDNAIGYATGSAPGYDIPVLHTVFAHLPCYNRDQIERDDGIHEFWGESIKRFWDKIWNTTGALGGAIWAGIDETNLFVSGNVSLEWGITDIWRRRKPEHYLTRKAYSPIVLHPETVVKRGDILAFTAENRFCHTNLSEVVMEWTWGGALGKSFCPDVKPLLWDGFHPGAGECEGADMDYLHRSLRISGGRIQNSSRSVFRSREPRFLQNRQCSERICSGIMLSGR